MWNPVVQTVICRAVVRKVGSSGLFRWVCLWEAASPRAVFWSWKRLQGTQWDLLKPWEESMRVELCRELEPWIGTHVMENESARNRPGALAVGSRAVPWASRRCAPPLVPLVCTRGGGMSLRAAGVLDPQQWVPLNLVKKEGGTLQIPLWPSVCLPHGLTFGFVHSCDWTFYNKFLLLLCAQEKLFLEI